MDPEGVNIKHPFQLPEDYKVFDDIIVKNIINLNG